jgi:hypothetical protein
MRCASLQSGLLLLLNVQSLYAPCGGSCRAARDKEARERAHSPPPPPPLDAWTEAAVRSFVGNEVNETAFDEAHINGAVRG